MKIRLGIVGAGLIWDRSHKHALKKLDRVFEVMAFAVRSQKTREKVEREYPDARVFHDYKKLVDWDEIDAVVVLTPLSLNAVVAMAALEAGKHAIVEKPLAVRPEDGNRIIGLEKETKRRVFVLEQLRYDDHLRTLKEILTEGRIGDVVSYEMARHSRIDDNRYNAGGYGNTDWRIHPEFPLGSLFDAGIHSITQLTFLFSRPDSVYAVGSQIRKGFGYYDHILMTFSHPNGIHGTVSYADYLDDGNNYFIVRGTTGTILVGTEQLEITGSTDGGVDLSPTDPNLAMWRQCAAWYTDHTVPIYGPAESLDDISTLVAVDESLRLGRNVILR